MAITNYQAVSSPSHGFAVPVAATGSTFVRNMGPAPVFLGDSGNGSTIPAQVISSGSGFPLMPGEMIELKAGTTGDSWLTFNTGPTPDDLSNTPSAVVRVMVIS
ncbi:MAG: hypothetical protein JWO11_3524 [Nocardioides sp.]|nr:hypothetical protein [Nocardioides sp.]